MIEVCIWCIVKVTRALSYMPSEMVKALGQALLCRALLTESCTGTGSNETALPELRHCDKWEHFL